jgi:hypothetical protein
MAGMKELVEKGEFPDLTEAIRASVNQFLEVKKHPSILHWFCESVFREGKCLVYLTKCRDCGNIQVAEDEIRKFRAGKRKPELLIDSQPLVREFLHERSKGIALERKAERAAEKARATVANESVLGKTTGSLIPEPGSVPA